MINEMMRLDRQFNDMDRRDLRQDSMMVENTICPKCGRKPTVRQGLCKTIVICRHMLCELEKRCDRQPDANPAGFGNHMLGVSTLSGIAIELYDDDPPRPSITGLG